MMNPEHINALIEANRYNVEVLPQLQQYVQVQVENHTYHLDANLTLLKFYQFHPEKTQKYIIGQILVKALMNLPNLDFQLCMYLIPEKLHHEEPIRILISLSHLLETATFAAFWVEANNCRELLDQIPGFDDSIRGFIIGVLTQTFQTLSKEYLSQVLNMKGTDLDAIITARGWRQTSDSVTFPKGDEFISKSKKVDQIKLEDLSRILSVVHE